MLMRGPAEPDTDRRRRTHLAADWGAPMGGQPPAAPKCSCSISRGPRARSPGGARPLMNIRWANNQFARRGPRAPGAQQVARPATCVRVAGATDRKSLAAANLQPFVDAGGHD